MESSINKNTAFFKYTCLSSFVRGGELSAAQCQDNKFRDERVGEDGPTSVRSSYICFSSRM